MITAEKIKEIVDNNNRRNFCLEIKNRAEMESMVYFVADLLKASGYEDAAYFTAALGEELENMDAEELRKVKIWE